MQFWAMSVKPGKEDATLCAMSGKDVVSNAEGVDEGSGNLLHVLWKRGDHRLLQIAGRLGQLQLLL